MWLYHATYKANINSIKKWGLGAIQNKNWNISIKNNVCLSPNPEEANSFCECAEDVLDDIYNSGIVVLATNTTNLKKELLKQDPNILSAKSFIYPEIIPSNALYVITNKKIIGKLNSLKTVPLFY